MKLKAKKALLEAAVMVLTGNMIAVWIFTQTGDISVVACFILCGLMMAAQAWCIWKGGWWNC